MSQYHRIQSEISSLSNTPTQSLDRYPQLPHTLSNRSAKSSILGEVTMLFIG